QGRHLINTRGCGLVMAPVGQVLQDDRPDYQPIELNRPELYFSPTLSGYAIARTSQGERACPGGATADYVGTKGVKMSSFVRRGGLPPPLPPLHTPRSRRHTPTPGRPG